MTTDRHTDSLRQFRFVRGAVLVLLAYWAAYAVMIPVTIWDSHAYNLARVLLAHHGGLFGNPAWNDQRQMVFPWAFDAVHYLFLVLGWGYALPSLACFVGLLLIVFRMVQSRFDGPTAWYCCLGMLALPTVVYQASSTKNDLAVVFGVGCWVYALWRFEQEKHRGFLLCGALGLSFAAGAKSSGLPLYFLLSAYTIWRLRSDKRQLSWFVGCSALSFILLGSVEIYVNNYRVWGNFIGPPFIVDHRNADGFDGTVANFVRYVIGSTDIGLDLANRHSVFAEKLQKVCHATLDLMHLENKGYRPDYSDATLVIVKDGGEAGTAYGPLGTISLWMAAVMLFSRPHRDLLWRLSLAGFGSLLLTCATIGWMPWNMRFLILPFLLFTLATTILATGPEAGSVLGRRAFLFVALGSAIFFPVYSVNKSPRDLWRSMTDRDWIMVKERPGMLEIINDLHWRHDQIGRAPLLLSGGQNSWVLPVLQMRDLQVIPSPHIDLARLQQTAKQSGSDSVYVLALNNQLPPMPNLTLLKTYKESDSALLLWRASQANAPPAK